LSCHGREACTRAPAFSSRIPTTCRFATKGLVIFATLQDAPNVIQSLYLRVPMLAYTGLLIFLSLYIGTAMHRAGM